MTARASVLAILTALGANAGTARGDDLSGADKLRVIWSNQMTWTPAGIPIVTVGVLDGRDEIVVEGEAMRVLPDGEGGAELAAGSRWTVRLAGKSTPAVVRWYVVVASGSPGEAERLQKESAAWRERGYQPRTFESGTVFGLRGEVIDMRRLLVGVAPEDSAAQAREAARTLGARFHVETSLHPVIIERPHGILEARDERGTVVWNDGVVWFAPGRERGAAGTLALADVPREGQKPERRDFGGRLYVTVGSDGKLAAANAVPEDKLLAGLLPAEIGAGAGPEALKAQAVAARNELFAKLGTRHLTDPYRLCSRVHCQVYAGAGHEDPRADAAIAATRGELLVHPDGTVVDAVYSAACGGHTEDNDRAWGVGPEPALRGVLDADADSAKTLGKFSSRVDDVESFLGPLPARPACAAASSFRWSARVEAPSVVARGGVGRIRDVELLERGVSGRVVRLRLVGDKSTKEVRGELEVRRLFGGLKSSLFVMAVERDAAGFATAFTFRGGGHGHGVGMCQAGAIRMADEGRTYRDILRRYYKDATIRKLY